METTTSLKHLQHFTTSFEVATTTNIGRSIGYETANGESGDTT
jgi:hypothetical protein